MLRRELGSRHSPCAFVVPSSRRRHLSDHVSPLVHRLHHENASIRVAAVRELRELGGQAAAAVPALISALSDPHWVVAATAAGALGRIGAAAATAVPALTRALRHPDYVVRRAAGEALGNLPEVDGEAIRALDAVAVSDAIAVVRAECSWASDRCKARRAESPWALYAPLVSPGSLRKLFF